MFACPAFFFPPSAQLLEKCKQHLKKGLKKDASKAEFLEQMRGIHQKKEKKKKGSSKMLQRLNFSNR
jgi:hypothetical protein